MDYRGAHDYAGKAEDALATLATLAELVDAGHAAAARPLVRRVVGRKIQQTGRDAYRDAAKLLQRLRDAHGRLDDHEAFPAYIAELRDQNRRKRALQDELTQRGL